MKNKIKIGFVGINGKMCKAVINTLLDQGDIRERVEIIAGIEKQESILLTEKKNVNIPELEKVKIYKNVKEIKDNLDIIIDFSLPEATLFQLENLGNRKIAYVIGTTGFNNKQISKIRSYAKSRPIVMSGNFSIGINLLLFVLEKVLPIEAINSFDIEVSETHHRQKIDAPSGTAKMILEKIKKLKGLAEKHLVYDRHKTISPRKKKEVGITSRRGGGVIGEHEVDFYGDNEIFTLKHSAINRTAFTYGVIEAIDFCCQKLKKNQNGLYGIKDVLRLKP